jgi:hypothetical protein
MQELIDVIRASVSSGATSEHKAAGAQACRTILAALDSEPGKPISLPGAPSPSPPGLSIDQVLDLAIARLSTIATEREAAPQLQPQPAPTGLRVPTMPSVPRAAPRAAPKVVAKPRKP